MEKLPALESTLKSTDTEEFIDIHFYRPIGYWWACLFHKWGVTPNQITIASIFIGVAAGVCFGFTSVWINLVGIFLLIWANSYDSADGQLARMTNQKSELGRILDGACGDFWFIAIYIAIIVRLWNPWSLGILLLAVAAGYSHTKQAAMADYFRNVHLLFLKGKSGSELDNSKDLAAKYPAISWREKPFVKFFEYTYLNYTRGQEAMTPALQKMLHVIQTKYDGQAPATFCADYRAQSLPLIPYTNLLSFNLRAIVLFISVLINFPAIYFIFELTVMNGMLIYMLQKYEKICSQLTTQLDGVPVGTGMTESDVSFPRRRKSPEANDLPFSEVKGLIFDYGATIDSNGKHWAEVLWEGYVAAGVPISKEQFREAYVYGERYLATHPVIKSDDNFRNLLHKKIESELNFLVEQEILPKNEKITQFSLQITNQSYNFARSTVENAIPTLQKLAAKYPMVLVSNFYGNIEAVLNDFGLDTLFKSIVESAVVNVRKPDPAIFALGVKALGLTPGEVVVIGDSYRKDIAPAQSLGCQTIWLKGQGWDEEIPGKQPGAIIEDFKELCHCVLDPQGRID
jgi:HAD superfamily hydrolase (TIGR01509 family)